MKDKILAIYRQLQPEVRAGICDLAIRIIWAVENDHEILPLIIERPSEQATIERHAEAIVAARTAIIAAISNR
jgi:hypothetical protein